jgi:hypothetical protein
MEQQDKHYVQDEQNYGFTARLLLAQTSQSLVPS